MPASGVGEPDSEHEYGPTSRPRLLGCNFFGQPAGALDELPKLFRGVSLDEASRAEIGFAFFGQGPQTEAIEKGLNDLPYSTSQTGSFNRPTSAACAVSSASVGTIGRGTRGPAAA